jgi:light-regulated signal transduction histidine kinase (bacteriophytochrome)
LKVLLVDDNEPDLDATARLLRKEFGKEIVVDSAETGGEALRALADGDYDAALVDYLLPDMDGLELLTQIHSAHPDTAVLLLSGQGSEVVATGAMKRGARDYLVKRDINTTTLRRSLTQAVQLTRIDRAAKSHLHSLERDRTEFDQCMRSLSHDMTATFMLLEDSLSRLKETGSQSETSEFGEGIQHVEACLRESKRYLDDLRTLAKTGTVSYECSRVDVQRVVHDIVYEMTDQFAKRNILVSVGGKLPSVWCHAGRMAQIISNLVRNAVLHGCDAHRPRISIEAVRRSDLDARLAWIKVFDNGPGIPRDHHEAVFQPGVRLRPENANGTGMGLAIVRDLVSHFGGQVLIDSQTEAGCGILVGLPKRANQGDVTH